MMGPPTPRVSLMPPPPDPPHPADPTHTHQGTASFAEIVAAVSPSPPPPPSTPVVTATPIAGPSGFDIVRKLDEGGMGEVYLARDRAMNRLVALKVMKLNVFDAASARDRFAREVRAMARIEHSNLVPIYHSGEFRGVPYFTMRYLAGGTLAGVKPRPVSAERGADLLRQVARGVSELHAAGILHRDLKPSNILLDDAGVPHVADFGLVKWLDEDDQSVTGPRHGTPPYMSPEQTLGHSRRLVPACDVWALGVIGYELLTGRRPFVASDRDDLYDLIREAEPANPRVLAPALPEPLADILLRCLRKPPAERYAHGGALADDLDRFLAGEPLAAMPTVSYTAPAPPPAPPPVEPPRPTRRRALLAGLAVVGVAAGGGAWWLRRAPFADRALAALRGGKPVTLIGETGLPEWHRIVPANGGELTAERGDAAVLAATDVGRIPHAFLELFADPLPVPVRLEGELRWATPPESISRMGLYVGHRSWPTDAGEWQTACAVWQEPATPGKPGLQNPMPEGYRLGAVVAPPPSVPNSFEGVAGRPAGRPATAPPPAAAEWVPFGVWLPPGEGTGAGAAVFRGPVATAQPLTAKRYLALLRPPRLPAPAPPVSAPDFAAAPDPFGPGLGVYVRAARVAIRNVRLVPLG